MWKKSLFFILGEIAVVAAGYGLTMQFPESSPLIWYSVAACAVALMVAVSQWDRILDYLRRKSDMRVEGHITFGAPEMTVSVGKRPAEKPTFPLTMRRLLGKLFP